MIKGEPPPGPWPTAEAIAAAREWFEAHTPGWCRPTAHGLAVIDSTGDVQWPQTNGPMNYLPAAVMAHTLGGIGPADTVAPLTSGNLETAIEALSPAEACTIYDHPNLAAWRSALSRLATGEARHVFAVFSHRPSGDPAATLASALARHLGPPDPPEQAR